MDLSQLLGGEGFTVSTLIGKNGYVFDTSSLVDSGANGYLFINTTLAYNLAKKLNLTLYTLPIMIPIKGFNSKRAEPLTYVIFLNLQLNGRRFLREPLLVTDLNEYDLIISRK